MRNMPLNKALEQIIATKVNEIGGQTYYVGGYVRDQFLGIENKDIDIEIHGVEPANLYKILQEVGKPKTFGKNFGIYSLNNELDIALPRSEKNTGKGHRDFEVYVDPYIGTTKAIQRRDFTINAIYKNVLTNEIIDPFNGVQDINKKIIRCVDDKTFLEDPLRVLRGCQFASRFNFKIDNKTINLCKRIDLSYLSKQRVEDELKKCLLKGKPSIFFKYLKRMNQDDNWFKEIKVINDKAIKYRNKVNYPYEFMLSYLTLNLNKKQLNSFLNRIVTKKSVIEYVLNMHELVNAKVNNNYNINKMFYDSIDQVDLIYLRMTVNQKDKFLLNKLDDYKQLMKKPYVQGKDLISLGYKPSEEFSKLLSRANTLRLKGYSKQEVIKKLKK